MVSNSTTLTETTYVPEAEDAEDSFDNQQKNFFKIFFSEKKKKISDQKENAFVASITGINSK